MTISSLEVEDFRNLKGVRITPNPRLNLVIGPNGSGKTSLLEAIHCLGRGKSFRTHKTNRLISKGKPSFTLVARVQQKGRSFTIGMQRKHGESIIRLAGSTISRSSELTQALPIALLEPGLHRLIEEGPEHRRKFLDWGVFHVEPGFHSIWADYRRVLAQRNAALRTRGTKATIVNWDRELVQAAIELDRVRRQYLDSLIAHVPGFSDLFPIMAGVEIQYHQGWKEGEDYANYLQAHFDSDQERGFTQFGPHRADLRIRIRGVDAREYLSRGQQKVFVTSLVLAQCAQMLEKDTSVVLLVDDLPSELDEEKRLVLLDCLGNTGAQVFISGTDSRLFPLAQLQGNGADHSVFHVEQGRVCAVS
ncbi:MAG TPA: DNA replication/repair protein RecF [Gammaproteobacteria bacterium]|nr:DNA replication/repair protein RecF [Gammaproteobacteria bacterium]